ncbi:MAG: pyruvate dehydrogenase complex E1 component subunit beta [Armatimonadetes bacterium]|nr:pyruvate dehydrogenase complex E1 component subunit beta [Armatimonadota bacterium]
MAVMMYRQALNLALREEMRRDPNVCVIGEEVAEYEGAYRVTEGLLQEFGEKRVVDTPISEEGIAGTGIGAAMVGLRPVVEMMTVNFALLAMDQIVNHAAKLRYMSGGQIKVPLVIRAPQGAGMQLGAQHSQNLESWFMHVPGLKVVAAATPYDAKGLLKSAIRDDNPVIFLEHELLYTMKGEVPEEEYTVPLEKADIKREGKSVTIITYLRMVAVSLAAANALASEGIEAEVIDLRTLRPMDIDTLTESVRKTHRAIVVEEDWPTCGAGAEIMARLQETAFDYFDAPIIRVTSEDVPMPYSKNLERSALPDEQKVIDAVHCVLGHECRYSRRYEIEPDSEREVEEEEEEEVEQEPRLKAEE